MYRLSGDLQFKNTEAAELAVLNPLVEQGVEAANQRKLGFRKVVETTVADESVRLYVKVNFTSEGVPTELEGGLDSPPSQNTLAALQQAFGPYGEVGVTLTNPLWVMPFVVVTD